MAQAPISSKATMGKESLVKATSGDGRSGEGLRGLLGTLWKKESMRRTIQAFDRSGRLARPSYRRLAAEAWAQVVYRPPPPEAEQLPAGVGHGVLVIPAFLTADAITGPLRAFLARCGYRAFGWELGTNWGPTPYILEALRRRLDACCDLAGGQVSVIGFSLGGLLARDLAHDRPRDIDHVVTVVSPFRLPTATPMEAVLRVCAPFYSDHFETERLARPLAMSSTAIYTRDDGVVPWESCCSEEPLGACFETRGAHTTTWRNPEVMRLIAQRLRPAG
jgi:pimeloyl-ACP methyl ester carboxylesterase